MVTFLVCALVVIPFSVVMAIGKALAQLSRGTKDDYRYYRVYRENKYDNDYGTIDYLNKKK